MRENNSDPMAKLEIAGIPFGVISQQDVFAEWACSGHETEGSPLFVVSATDEEIAEELSLYGGRLNRTQCESNILYRKVSNQLLEYDAFLLHAAVVAMDGEAYAFTARSGTGKSTHARYWLQAFGGRAFILNGDKPILKWHDGTFYACGTPWRGKERLGTADCLPLKAIYLLDRAAENRVMRATPDDIVERLVAQTLLPSQMGQTEKLFDLIDRLTETVPIYNLYCNMSVDAALTAYEGARWNEHRDRDGEE